MEQAIREDERATVLREMNERQQEAAQRFMRLSLRIATAKPQV
jgi:hypothetical protein